MRLKWYLNKITFLVWLIFTLLSHPHDIITFYDDCWTLHYRTKFFVVQNPCEQQQRKTQMIMSFSTNQIQTAMMMGKKEEERKKNLNFTQFNRKNVRIEKSKIVSAQNGFTQMEWNINGRKIREMVMLLLCYSISLTNRHSLAAFIFTIYSFTGSLSHRPS